MVTIHLEDVGYASINPPYRYNKKNAFHFINNDKVKGQ